MNITHVKTSEKKDVIIELLTESDYKGITKEKYHFDWKTEKSNTVYKLRLLDDNAILGLMSIKEYPSEDRIEIVLLASSTDNTGKNKIYEGIAGALIAYACREAIKLFGENACVSITPKTELKKYYMKQYGMLDAGRQIFLETASLFNLLNKYAV
jgi:hypothetical protein